MGFCNSMFCCALLCFHSFFCNHLDGEERAGCFDLFVLLVSRKYYVPFPHAIMPRICLQFVIVVFPDLTHLLFLV